ncbi:unnamed protein product [Ambrosiozyma monospora]|uniref:Unnamed protein product n=1 Tax=Ambrosiozyma monospora TaxID=43982 RepID=A0ACB5TJB3_AMBMO|nr:unnamed protein product [Ambrosiozyma monospora]
MKTSYRALPIFFGVILTMMKIKLWVYVKMVNFQNRLEINWEAEQKFPNSDKFLFSVLFESWIVSSICMQTGMFKYTLRQTSDVSKIVNICDSCDPIINILEFVSGKSEPLMH